MVKELLSGFEGFRREVFPWFEERYRTLVAEGQKPSTLFVGCSDSRVVPEQFLDTEPGNLFMVRNVGNIVPPVTDQSASDAVAAAVNYALDVLNVTDIVVCGHSHCGAVRALYDPPASASDALKRWVNYAAPARLDEPLSEETLRRSEQRNILVQLDHLLKYPEVERRVEAGKLGLHGWHYIIEEGEILQFDPEKGEFTHIQSRPA